MINSLFGVFSGISNSAVLLQNSGIEWEILTSLNTLSSCPETGTELKLFVWLYHRDDQMKLFGFITEEERSVFLELQKVEGIGPRQALKILSGVSVKTLKLYLDTDNVEGLCSIPGLGKKTASKLILELKGKLTESSQVSSAGQEQELIQALSDLGFDKQAAKDVLRKIFKEENPVDLIDEKEILRKAIIFLSGR